MGEDTPPPLPPEPKKTAAGRLKDYVISAATSPEILLPVLGIVAIILLRDHLEAPVARYIAGIVTNEENFKPDDENKDRANPLDAYMLSSLLNSEDQQLRTKVQALIAEEIQRLDILESEYGRADGIFRNQVRFSSADREGLEKTITFVAHRNQRVFLYATSRNIIKDTSRSDLFTAFQAKSQPFNIRSSVREQRILTDQQFDITPMLTFPDGAEWEIFELTIPPGNHLVDSIEIVANVSIIVANEITATTKQAPPAKSGGRSSPTLPVIPSTRPSPAPPPPKPPEPANEIVID